MITEVLHEGQFYRLSTGRAAHYENIKPHNPSTEDWCIPADMEEGDYLMMDPACEVNEKGIRRMTHTPIERLVPWTNLVWRTISKTTKGSGQSGDIVNMTNSEMRTSKNRNTGLCDATADPEVDDEKRSRQRIKARIATSTKLIGIDRVTPPLVTPLVDNGASIEEALTNIVGSIGEQNEQMSLKTSELERAVHTERENLREEINRNRQEVSRSEKRLKKRTKEHLARNLSRMTREAEQRELRLRDDMEKLRIQQEQTLGTIDMKIDAMMGRRTQAIMDRLNGLLGSGSGSKNGDSNSGEPSREPRVNFNEQQNRRRTYGSTRERGRSSTYTTGDNRIRSPNIRGSS